MKFFNLFKRTKKAKSETEKPIVPSPEQTLFAETGLELIGLSIRWYGFIKQRIVVEKHSATIVFRKGRQYISITSSTYPTDYPCYYNIKLGEGADDGIEGDWNSFPLWQLKKKVEPSVEANAYEFPNKENLKSSLLNASEEL